MWKNCCRSWHRRYIKLYCFNADSGVANVAIVDRLRLFEIRPVVSDCFQDGGSKSDVVYSAYFAPDMIFIVVGDCPRPSPLISSILQYGGNKLDVVFALFFSHRTCWFSTVWDRLRPLQLSSANFKIATTNRKGASFSCQICCVRFLRLSRTPPVDFNRLPS